MKNVVVILVFTLFFLGCKEDEVIMNTPPPAETVFFINSYIVGTEEDTTSKVKFDVVTNDFSKVPELIIDGISNKYWYPLSVYPLYNNLYISGGLAFFDFILPYKNSISFNINKDKLITEGIIKLPAKIENFRCNGKSITSGNFLMIDTIPTAPILKFEWECESADSFQVEIIHPSFADNRYSFYNYTGIYENVTLIPGTYIIRITAIKGGVNFDSPHFWGSYGKGFSISTWRFDYEIVIINQ